MPSGGPRQGTPGKQYSNRRDLAQAPKAPRGQVYGERKRQEDAQKVIPLPQRPGTPRTAPQAGGPIPPGALTSLTTPTQLPDEPLTTGLRLGEGAGPEALATPGGDDSLEMLRAIYSRYPFEDLRRLIERAELRGAR